jgi:7-cyano-7-deazaguanine synthase
MPSSAVVIFSGGLDSTTLLYHLRAEGREVRALSIDYGQRHRLREMQASAAICRVLGVERRVVDLTSVVQLLGKNSLTHHAVAIPDGPYSATTVPLTTVPNRNMILLSLGIAWAISVGSDAVAFGAHAGPRTNYPDCSPEFAAAMDAAANRCDSRPVSVLAPFVTWSKADIVRRGQGLDVPFELTWSCYKGGDRHCGECGTCHDRKEAFGLAGVRDSTDYAS